MRREEFPIYATIEGDMPRTAVRLDFQAIPGTVRFYCPKGEPWITARIPAHQLGIVLAPPGSQLTDSPLTSPEHRLVLRLPSGEILTADRAYERAGRGDGAPLGFRPDRGEAAP